MRGNRLPVGLMTDSAIEVCLVYMGTCLVADYGFGVYGFLVYMNTCPFVYTLSFFVNGHPCLLLMCVDVAIVYTSSGLYTSFLRRGSCRWVF